jgi:hypothetical protein
MAAYDQAKASKPDRPVRTLKVEADGDSWKGLIKPKIRLMGYWLERAGFKPGTRVCVTCLGSGVIELRSDGASGTDGARQAASDEPDCPV